MARFYVYTLSYPPEMGGAVFYVGKGCGARMYTHEVSAAEGAKGKRYDAIRAIWEDGYQVVKAVVFQSDDEAECLAEERARIIALHSGALTNEKHNHSPKPPKMPKPTKPARQPIDLNKASSQLRWLSSQTGGNLTQVELARKLGTSKGVISLYISHGVLYERHAELIGIMFERRLIRAEYERLDEQSIAVASPDAS